MELLIILILIAINGVLALAEIAIISSRKARLQHAAKEGSVGAKTALDLAHDPSYFLSTIQVGITLVGILTGAFSGATFSATVATYLEPIPIISLYADGIAFFLVVLLVTFFSICFGELVPKRIALSNPEKIAMSVSRPMALLARLTAPFVRLLSGTTDMVVGLFGINKDTEESISEEEIKILISQATTAGVIEEAEQEIINKIMLLGDKRVRDIMTPHSEIEWLDATESKTKILEAVNHSHHSHYPVYRETKDEIIGFIHVKDLLEHWSTKKSEPLEEFVQKPLFIIETTTVLNVLELFRTHNSHIALVVDEYGSVEGIITVNDIFESIVGEVPDIDEVEDPHITKRDADSWLVDGILSIDEFKYRFHIKKMWKETEDNYQSLGGFIMNYLDTIPKPGDSFEWNHYRFEVVDMDGNRVDKVLLVKLPKPVSEADHDRGTLPDTSSDNDT